AVGDQAAAAVGIAVAEGPVHDVGDGLKAAVRVPGRALRLAGCVLDGSEVVEQQEGVGPAQLMAGKGPAHLEALALERGNGGDDLLDRALAGDGWVGLGDAGEGEGVRVDGRYGRAPSGLGLNSYSKIKRRSTPARARGRACAAGYGSGSDPPALARGT